MGEPAEVRCDRCGRALRPGALKFAVRIAITADFDGHLGEAREPETSLAQALAEAGELTEEELSAGVHQELAFLLCPGCRAELVARPLSEPFLRHGGGMVQ